MHINAQSSCVDISGTYRVDATTAERFTQTKCVRLEIEFGQIQSDGSVDWYKIPEKSSLDGTPVCDTFGCVTGHADNLKVELGRDKPWVAWNAQHGDCLYNRQSFSLGAGGSLIQHQSVYQCHDGYTGSMENTFTRIN